MTYQNIHHVDQDFVRGHPEADEQLAVTVSVGKPVTRGVNDLFNMQQFHFFKQIRFCVLTSSETPKLLHLSIFKQ